MKRCGPLAERSQTGKEDFSADLLKTQLHTPRRRRSRLKISGTCG